MIIHFSGLGNLTFWQKMATTPMVPWFVALVIYYSGKEGLYQKQFSPHLRYAKPMQQRIGFLIIAASLLWLALWIHPYSYFWPLNVSMLGFAVGLVYLSGPSEVRIDLDRRTYKAYYGWPLMPKFWEGPLADISGVQVVQNSRSYAWVLILRWRTQRQGIILGQFSTCKKAEAAIAQVIESLGIDVPVPYTSSGSNLRKA